MRAVAAAYAERSLQRLRAAGEYKAQLEDDPIIDARSREGFAMEPLAHRHRRDEVEISYVATATTTTTTVATAAETPLSSAIGRGECITKRRYRVRGCTIDQAPNTASKPRLETVTNWLELVVAHHLGEERENAA